MNKLKELTKSINKFLKTNKIKVKQFGQNGFVDSEEKKCFAYYETEKKKIKIRYNLKGFEYFTSLLHEAVHASGDKELLNRIYCRRYFPKKIGYNYSGIALTKYGIIEEMIAEYAVIELLNRNNIRITKSYRNLFNLKIKMIDIIFDKKRKEQLVNKIIPREVDKALNLIFNGKTVI